MLMSLDTLTSFGWDTVCDGWVHPQPHV